MSSLRLPALVLAATLAPLGAPFARADDRTAPAPVVAHAEWILGPLAACATPPGIGASVSELLGRPVFVDSPGAADVRVRVRARQDSIDAWILELRAAEPDRPERVRRVFPGPVSCEAARRALVEMLALALDYARIEGVPGPRVQAPVEPEPYTPPPPPRWAVRLGLDATVARGLLPGVHAGVGGVVDVTPPGSRWSVALEALAWAPGAAATTDTDVPVGIRLWAWHLVLAGCHRFLDGAPIEVQACAGAVAGQVLDQRSYPQTDAVVGLDDRQPLFGLDLGLGLATSSRAPVQLVARVGALLPLSIAGGRYDVCTSVEPRCAAGDDAVVLHEPAWVVPRLSLGLRWRVE